MNNKTNNEVGYQLGVAYFPHESGITEIDYEMQMPPPSLLETITVKSEE